MFDDDPGMELEAIEQERHDADLLQARYERESNAFWHSLEGSKKMRAAGQLAEAADACPHGGGYPLDSLAAEYEGDPFRGEQGFRCLDCGSRLSAWPGGRVTVPCEFLPDRLR